MGTRGGVGERELELFHAGQPADHGDGNGVAAGVAAVTASRFVVLRFGLDPGEHPLGVEPEYG